MVIGLIQFVRVFLALEEGKTILVLQSITRYFLPGCFPVLNKSVFRDTVYHVAFVTVLSSSHFCYRVSNHTFICKECIERREVGETPKCLDYIGKSL